MDFKTRHAEAISGWFSLDDCKVKVKVPEPEDLEAVEKEFVTVKHEFVYNPNLGRMERVEWKEENQQQKNIALGARLIVEWENVKINGKIAKCTEANKRKLIAESPVFREFYTDSVTQLTEQVRSQYGSEVPAKN